MVEISILSLMLMLLALSARFCEVCGEGNEDEGGSSTHCDEYCMCETVADEVRSYALFPLPPSLSLSVYVSSSNAFRDVVLCCFRALLWWCGVVFWSGRDAHG